jgi:hypothetical protein
MIAMCIKIPKSIVTCGKKHLYPASEHGHFHLNPKPTRPMQIKRSIDSKHPNMERTN